MLNDNGKSPVSVVGDAGRREVAVTARAMLSSIAVCCLLLVSHIANATDAPGEVQEVLVLYDNAGRYGHIGKEHAIMLENLLGHFATEVDIEAVTRYQAGQMDEYDTVFYIGSTYEEPEKWLAQGKQERYDRYQDFLADVAGTNAVVVWMNHNILALADLVGGRKEFAERYGFRPLGIDPDARYNRVRYKDVELHKGVVVHANPGASIKTCINEIDGNGWVPGDTRHGPWDCDGALNIIRVDSVSDVEVHATAYSTLDDDLEETPYIISSGNFWYVGDLPFMYLSEEDRYLAFADVLHDILGSGIGEQPKRIMLRLEDVSPGVAGEQLEEVASYLEREGIPFTIAAIATHQDPRGVDSGGVPRSLEMPGSTTAEVIKRYYEKGLASIVMHGYSHQWSGGDNPFNGLTGDDFEFYRVTVNSDNSLEFHGPVPNDSAAWASSRAADAARMLLDSGFRPFAWEAPHYMASEADYMAIQEIFPVHYGRLIYFSDESPDGNFFGQFFPYPIYRDNYGYQVIPENMGNVTGEPFPGYRKVVPEDLIRYAEKLSVVRDRVASFFYHPTMGVGDLEKVVDGVRAAGYRFISPCDLGYRCDGSAVDIPEKEIEPEPERKKALFGAAAVDIQSILAIAVLLGGRLGRRLLVPRGVPDFRRRFFGPAAGS
ncbi:MAG TPA: DUF2334 domain-containing protein [Gammaproteobacteria bacterium]|nr:DUF2334 domain-containing protein [Gammaproteobacteria bacterium]